jgi:cytochrome P450
VEFAGEFADQLPISVIAAMLGLPWQDDDLLRRCKFLNDEFTRWSETFGDDPSVLQDARAAAAEMEDILRPYIRARRAAPEDDLISALWAEGPKILPDWDEDDVMSQCKTLFPAGGQTTAYLLCNMMFLLMQDPDLYRYVRGEPGTRLPPFIDEALRLHGTIHFRVREAVSDTVLRDVHIRAGQRVFPINSAGNRDGAKFDDPQTLRREGRPQRHLAFNVGPRVCVGEALARAEALEAYLRLFAAVADMRLEPAADPPRLTGFMSRSFRPLHLRVSAVAA